MPFRFGVRLANAQPGPPLAVPFSQSAGMHILPALEIGAAALAVGGIPFAAQFEVLLLVLLPPTPIVGVGPLAVLLSLAAIRLPGTVTVFSLPFA